MLSHSTIARQWIDENQQNRFCMSRSNFLTGDAFNSLNANRQLVDEIFGLLRRLGDVVRQHSEVAPDAALHDGQTRVEVLAQAPPSTPPVIGHSQDDPLRLVFSQRV